MSSFKFRQTETIFKNETIVKQAFLNFDKLNILQEYILTIDLKIEQASLTQMDSCPRHLKATCTFSGEKYFLRFRYLARVPQIARVP